MASSSSSRAAPARIARLWQLPLFLLSIGLFGYAAYLFIDPKPGLTTEQKIELARDRIKYDRPEAAIDQLNKLLGGEKLTLDNEARVHLLLAEAIELGQRLKKLDLPANHERIIEQSRIALSQGIKPEAEIYRRMGESYEAIGQAEEALKNYRRAEAMDVNRSLRLKRKVIELQIAQGDVGAAEASLDDYLKPDAKLSDSERAWALGEKSRLLADAGKFIEARALLGQALPLNPDPMAQGQLHYWLGYTHWKLGDVPEAERLLRVAREFMKVRHPTDAEAAFALGRICQDKGNFKEAGAFFETVLVSHPDSPVAPLAKLGRGMCRVSLGEDHAGLNDLQTLVSEISARPAHNKKKVPEVLKGLRDAAATLATRDNFQGALEVMAYEQMLTVAPAGEFFARLATVYERRAEQVDGSIAKAPNPDEKFRREQQTREFRTKAGDAYIAYAKALGGDDDEGYGKAIWQAVDLYDRAGSLPLSIAALELFVSERPDDGLAPDALLRLGRAFQAVGDFDKAIAVLHKNQYRYASSLAASKSGVPLAQAYIAKGPQFYAKAETTLKGVIEGNRLITPDADEFRQALFELAQLYYRAERFEEAGTRLGELTERYPDDPRMAQLLFLMGDSYRKSAALLREALAAKERAAADEAVKAGQAAAAAPDEGEPAADKDLEAKVARAALEKSESESEIKQRLNRAAQLYAAVVERFYKKAPEAEQDKLYLKLSYFYRADCMYDLGNYQDAIKLYDTAAVRYQDDPSALAAYVQIVNSWIRLGNTGEAKTANERAKWLLRKMPAGAFEAAGPAMNKQYWEQWLKWANDAGMFGPGPAIVGGQEPPPGQ